MTDASEDWNDLRVLLAVLEERSLSRAARRLNVTQPTIGRRLDELEARAPGLLVERTPRGCTPTPLGASLLPMLTTMRHAADGVNQSMQSAGRSLQGKVRVACGEVVGRKIAGALPRITAAAPDLALEIVVGMKNVNLERGDADIAIRNRPPTGANLHYRKVSSAQFAVYGAPSYLSAHPAALTDDRFAACRWVSFNEEQQDVPTYRWLRQHRATAPEIRLSHTSLIIEAVAAGAGLAALSVIAADADPRLAPASEPIDALGFDVLLVTHARSRRIARVRFVADRLAELLTPEQDARR